MGERVRACTPRVRKAARMGAQTQVAAVGASSPSQRQPDEFQHILKARCELQIDTERLADKPRCRESIPLCDTLRFRNV